MKAAVVLVEEVYLPGVHSDFMVPRPLGEALDRLWKREGFGCLEVVLASSRTPEKTPLPEDLNPLGALVELVIDQESLNSSSAEVRLDIADGHRIALDQPEAVTNIYGIPFDGIVTGYKGQRPTVTGFDDWDRLKHSFYNWLIAHGDNNQLEFAASTILEIERLHAPNWKIAYMIADRLLDSPADRLKVLSFDDAGEGVIALELEAMLLYGRDDATAGYAGLLEEILEESLEPTRAALEAASLFAKMELLDLPSGTSRTLRGIERELEKLGTQLEDLVVELKSMRRRGGQP